MDEPFERRWSPSRRVATPSPVPLRSGRLAARGRGGNGAFVLANRALAWWGRRAGGRRRRSRWPPGPSGPGTFLLKGALERAARSRWPRRRACGCSRSEPARRRHRDAEAGAHGLYKPWVANMDEGWTRGCSSSTSFRSWGWPTGRPARRSARTLDGIVLPERRSSRCWTAISPARCRPNIRTAWAWRALGAEGVRAAGRHAGGARLGFGLPLDLSARDVRNVLKGVSRTDTTRRRSCPRDARSRAADLAWGGHAEERGGVRGRRAGVRRRKKPHDEEGEETPALAPTDRPKPRSSDRFADKDVLYRAGCSETAHRRQGRAGGSVARPRPCCLIGFRPQFRASPTGRSRYFQRPDDGPRLTFPRAVG